jgi:hypothetical protein
MVGCSKEPIKEFNTYSLPGYMLEYLPLNQNDSEKYLSQQVFPSDAHIFYRKGGVFKAPTFNVPNPVDYSEKYFWESFYYPANRNQGIRQLTISIDTFGFLDNMIKFSVKSDFESKDSFYIYYFKPLPQNEKFQSDYQKYHAIYRLDNKDYYDCFELIGSNINNQNARLVFNKKDGIILFDAFRIRYKIYKP